MRLAFLLCAAAFAQDGGKLYEIHCAACHGMKGDGGKGSSLATPRLARARTDADLFNITAFGIEGTEMPPSRMTDAERWKLVAHVRELGRRPPADTGDPARGKRLYEEKGKCHQCHMIQGRGGHLGPELSEAGLRRNPAYLRTSIVDPQAAVPENFAFYRRVTYFPDNFLQVRVVTAEGRRITGTRLNEDTFTIQIRDLSGQFHHFEKADLKELHKDWGKSPMPSYQSMFSTAELDDLVAYLSSLRGLP